MSEKRPFRFGVQAAGVASRDEWVARAYRAESLGYDILTLPDHFGVQYAPFPALAVAAEATLSLRVGTFVNAVDYHHPVVLAKEAATLDILSSGRFELGLGAGWMREEYDAAGLPFDSPGTRIDRLAEALVIVKSLFGQGPTTFAGQHYRVTDLVGEPRPSQEPRLPILVGGGGRRLLTLGAREADIVSINPRASRAGGHDNTDIARETVAEKAAWVREAAGLRWEDLEVNLAVKGAAITDSPRAALAPFVARHALPEETLLASPHLLIGSVDGVVAVLQEMRERWGISYITIPERHMDEFAPVVARLRAS
jgi:probable F420-dependent oxidoreductase